MNEIAAEIIGWIYTKDEKPIGVWQDGAPTAKHMNYGKLMGYGIHCLENFPNGMPEVTTPLSVGYKYEN